MYLSHIQQNQYKLKNGGGKNSNVEVIGVVFSVITVPQHCCTITVTGKN